MQTPESAMASSSATAMADEGPLMTATDPGWGRREELLKEARRIGVRIGKQEAFVDCLVQVLSVWYPRLVAEPSCWHDPDKPFSHASASATTWTDTKKERHLKASLRYDVHLVENAFALFADVALYALKDYVEAYPDEFDTPPLLPNAAQCRQAQRSRWRTTKIVCEINLRSTLLEFQEYLLGIACSIRFGRRGVDVGKLVGLQSTLGGHAPVETKGAQASMGITVNLVGVEHEDDWSLEEHQAATRAVAEGLPTPQHKLVKAVAGTLKPGTYAYQGRMIIAGEVKWPEFGDTEFEAVWDSHEEDARLGYTPSWSKAGMLGPRPQGEATSATDLPQFPFSSLRQATQADSSTALLGRGTYNVAPRVAQESFASREDDAALSGSKRDREDDDHAAFEDGPGFSKRPRPSTAPVKAAEGRTKGKRNLREDFAQAIFHAISFDNPIFFLTSGECWYFGMREGDHVYSSPAFKAQPRRSGVEFNDPPNVVALVLLGAILAATDSALARSVVTASAVHSCSRTTAGGPLPRNADDEAGGRSETKAHGDEESDEKNGKGVERAVDPIPGAGPTPGTGRLEADLAATIARHGAFLWLHYGVFDSPYPTHYVARPTQTCAPPPPQASANPLLSLRAWKRLSRREDHETFSVEVCLGHDRVPTSFTAVVKVYIRGSEGERAESAAYLRLQGMTGVPTLYGKLESDEADEVLFVLSDEGQRVEKWGGTLTH